MAFAEINLLRKKDACESGNRHFHRMNNSVQSTEDTRRHCIHRALFIFCIFLFIVDTNHAAGKDFRDFDRILKSITNCVQSQFVVANAVIE